MGQAPWNIPYMQSFIKKLPEPDILHVKDIKFNFCVVGGTFDRLHMGHKTLLSTALAFSRRLLLCITTDEYVRELRKVAGDILSLIHI